MLPEWMEKQENYIPPRDGSRFIVESAKSIGKAMARIKIQKGHEKGRSLPPLFKLCLMFVGILVVSLSQSRIPVMTYAAVVLLYLCTWPAIDIWNIWKAGLAASFLAFLVLLPAMILHTGLIRNELFIVVKVFLSIVTVSIFNHTTQWNHVTKALRQLHIPGIFIFTLDITLKYIVLLGNLIADLLTSLQLRSVGRNNRKYSSIGGVMGVTFVRGAEMNRQMYEAMLCRGFTDDYDGLATSGTHTPTGAHTLTDAHTPSEGFTPAGAHTSSDTHTPSDVLVPSGAHTPTDAHTPADDRQFSDDRSRRENNYESDRTI